MADPGACASLVGAGYGACRMVAARAEMSGAATARGVRAGCRRGREMAGGGGGW
jgi:hypothetical protein